MGCDIHTFAEKKNPNGQWEVIPDCRPFQSRNYGLFGWLADVRNYSSLKPISEPKGFPDDASPEVFNNFEDWDCDAHTPSWVLVEELLNFNYDSICEDRRVTKQLSANFFSGGETCDSGEGVKTSYREFFGDEFFEDFEELKSSGAERIVFWFDN